MSTTYLQHDLVTSLRHELGYEPMVAKGFGNPLKFAVVVLSRYRSKGPVGPVALEDEVEILKHAAGKTGVECRTWPSTTDDRYSAILYAEQATTFSRLAKAGLTVYRESNKRLGRRHYAVVKAKETIDDLTKPKKEKGSP